MFGSKKNEKPDAKTDAFVGKPLAAPDRAVSAPQAGAPAPQVAPTNGAQATSAALLFYKDPQLLSSQAHAHFKLKPGDASFAAETVAVPLVASEFAEASRSFPIVFAAESSAPVALLGLEKANVFVERGQWSEGAYMPAYVRRYPFVIIGSPEGDKFALGVDLGSGRISDQFEGDALFKDGQPSVLTQQALAFCQAFQADHAATKLFSAALKDKNLLLDRRADVTLPNGRKLGLQGFEVVDPARLATLDEATVLDWHRKGWLALVHFHLASLAGFRDLLSRQAAREASIPLAG